MLRSGIQSIRSLSAGILFIIGVGLSYLFVTVGFWSLVGPVAGVAVGSCLAIMGSLSVRIFNWKSTKVENTIAHSWKLALICCCLYIIAIVVGTRFYLYERPAWFYFLFPLYAGIIAYQIARGQHEYALTLQLSVFAFFTYWSSQFLFPAGMYNPDTHYRYVPNMKLILETGILPSSETIYAGHYAMALGFSLVTGLDPQIGYYLLSTLLLVLTILLITVLHRPLPAIPRSTALYGALVFAISSWMLRRGFHPNKLNFFYPLVLVMGISALYLAQSQLHTQNSRNNWAIVSFIVTPSIIFGHQFSAGATMIFLSAIAGFVIVSKLLPLEYNISLSTKAIIPIVSVYILSVMGNPIHQQSLLGRLSGLLLSIVETQSSSSTASTGGAGRYSELSLDFLITSTTAQTILFAIVVVGAIWMFRQEEWEYDLIIFWLSALSLFMIISLIFNSADTQPQRFYAFLILFGFNLCAGTFLYLIEDYSIRSNIELGNIAIVIIVSGLALSSLVSPVADEVMSPVADDLPHNKKFTTNQELSGNDWSAEYTESQRSVVPLNTNVPVTQTGANTGQINVSTVDSGTVILYSNLAQRTGVITGSGLSFGGRTYVFVPPPKNHYSNVVYTNGESTSYQT